jgi:hypothetical protein
LKVFAMANSKIGPARYAVEQGQNTFPINDRDIADRTGRIKRPLSSVGGDDDGR